MYFDGEYRFIGTVDIAALSAAVDALDEATWLEMAGRQQAFAAHRKTQTIPLIFDPDMRHTDPTIWPRFTAMQSLVAPAMKAVEDFFAGTQHAGPAGYFARVILVRLDAGESIGTHKDHGDSLSRAHRIHLPIRTNDKAEFGIAGRIRHLPAGEIWEINNRKIHAVRNFGAEARVHLILDYVLPGEVVEDPEGRLVA